MADPSNTDTSIKQGWQRWVGASMLASVALAVAGFLLTLVVCEIWNGLVPPFRDAPRIFRELDNTSNNDAHFKPGSPSAVGTAQAAGGVQTRYVLVFFENGSHLLDRVGVRQLNRLGHALRDCGDARVVVSGYASSAPFRSDSDRRNIELASQRVAYVVWHLRQSLRDEQVQQGSVFRLEDREYSDAAAGVGARRPVEMLNRSAKVALIKGHCLALPRAS